MAMALYSLIFKCDVPKLLVLLVVLIRPLAVNAFEGNCQNGQKVRHLEIGRSICFVPIQCKQNEQYVLCRTHGCKDRCVPCGDGTVNPFSISTGNLDWNDQKAVCKEPVHFCYEEIPPGSWVSNIEDCMKTGEQQVECNRSKGWTGRDIQMCYKATVSCTRPNVELTLDNTCSLCKKGYSKKRAGAWICTKDKTLSKPDNEKEPASKETIGIKSNSTVKGVEGEDQGHKNYTTSAPPADKPAGQDSRLSYLIYIALILCVLAGLIICLVYHCYKKLRELENQQDRKRVVQNGNASINGSARDSVAVPMPNLPTENPERNECSPILSSITSTLHSGITRINQILSSGNGTVPPNPVTQQTNHVPAVNEKVGDTLPGQNGHCSLDARIGAAGIYPRIGGTQACPSMPSYAGNPTGTQASSNQPGAGPVLDDFRSHSRQDPRATGIEQIPPTLPEQQRGGGMQPSQVNGGISSHNSSARQSMQRRQDSGLGTGTERSSQSDEDSKPVARVPPSRIEQPGLEHSSLIQTANQRFSSGLSSSIDFSILDSQSVDEQASVGDVQVDPSLTHPKTVYNQGVPPHDEESQDEDEDPQEEDTLLKEVELDCQ